MHANVNVVEFCKLLPSFRFRKEVAVGGEYSTLYTFFFEFQKCFFE